MYLQVKLCDPCLSALRLCMNSKWRCRHTLLFLSFNESFNSRKRRLVGGKLFLIISKQSNPEYVFRYFAPGRGAKYCEQRGCMSVCLFVCSLAYLKKTQFQISPNFLCILSAAVARFSSAGNAISYVLPVLRMTSCFTR